MRKVEQIAWVSVDERLPEDGRNVMVTLSNRKVVYDAFWVDFPKGTAGRWQDAEGRVLHPDVVAWAEQPKGYGP
jgi:hypothetical protein